MKLLSFFKKNPQTLQRAGTTKVNELEQILEEAGAVRVKDTEHGGEYNYVWLYNNYRIHVNYRDSGNSGLPYAWIEQVKN